ncbi:MAG: hypothetical protein IT237_00045 [Bacteroidia bacterium]|nr:hypothetical protein [Bacteroidia bacterium]
MKNYLIVLFILISVSLFSQNQDRIDLDLFQRKVLSAKYLKESNYQYQSGQGKAVHQLIIEYFNNTALIPPINYEVVKNPQDAKNIVSLIEGLNSIMILPLSWDMIIEMETKRVLLEDKMLNRNHQLEENK